MTALPTRPRSGPDAPAGSWRMRDELRLVLGALRDAGERAHAGRLDVRAAHDLDLHPGQLARPRGQRLGREQVGRRVAEVARAVGGLGAGAPGLDRGGDVVVRGHDERLRGAILARIGLERRVAVGGEQRALHERARHVVADLVRQLPAQRRACRARAPGRARSPPRSARARGRRRRAPRSRRGSSAARRRARGRASASFASASPDSTSAPSVPSGTSWGTPLPSKIPTTIVSAPVSGGSSVVALTSMAGGYRPSHAQDRDPRHRPHARRQARRRPVQPPGHRARRDRHPRRARARGRRTRAGPARRHGPGAAGRRRPDPLAPGADRRRDPQGGLLRDDQQGLRLRRARRRPARRRDPGGRRRRGRRGRDGVDVAGARTCCRRPASARAWAT